MKKFIALFLVVLFFWVGPALARKVEINLALTASGATTSTESLYIDSISDGSVTFGKMGEAATGTENYILSDRGNMPSPCWSIQPITATTSGGDSTFDLAYKTIDVDLSAAAWTAAPLKRIARGVSGNASAYTVSYFNPPPAKYLRFYVTSGATDFTTFTSRVIVTDNVNCPEPELVRLSVESLTLNASGVSNFTEPADVSQVWANLIGGPFRFGDSSSNPSSSVGQKYYDGDTLIFYGKDDADDARFLLDSTASSGVVYVIYYGRP